MPVINPSQGIVTPIIRDARKVAQELGWTEALLEHQRIVLYQPAKAYDLVEQVLIALGVTNAELLSNLQRGDRSGD